MNKTLPTLLALALPFAATADDELRRESCLLGQETATLYYELLQKRPELAKKIHSETNTKIDRRAYYWASVYFEHGKSYEELAERYLYVCMRTGPVRIPAPQL